MASIMIKPFHQSVEHQQPFITLNNYIAITLMTVKMVTIMITSTIMFLTPIMMVDSSIMGEVLAMVMVVTLIFLCFNQEVTRFKTLISHICLLNSNS